MAVAIVCDGCGVVGPRSPHSPGPAEDQAITEGWGYGSRPFLQEIDGMTFTGGWRTILCPECRGPGS